MIRGIVIHRHHVDGAETINLVERQTLLHRIQLGYGSGGDGFCYLHQSFSCLDHLSNDEREALNSAE